MKKMLKLGHIKNKRELRKYYRSLIPRIREIAREHGYAVAEHGSQQRDLDLIIVPWVKKVKKPESMIIAIEKDLGLTPHMRSWWKVDCLRPGKPHGRKCYSIHLGWWGRCTVKVKNNPKKTVPHWKGFAYIDISILGV